VPSRYIYYYLIIKYDLGGKSVRFDDFDAEMRTYEESLDQYIPEEEYIVVRLDGRSFTRLTKRVCKFKAPFDARFRDLMTDAVKSLMNSGFKIVYGYTESDEISLLFHPDEDTFSRKVRKINTTLAGRQVQHFHSKSVRLQPLTAV
jgi:tRNA(His) 5'-end guanylyltransferase